MKIKPQFRSYELRDLDESSRTVTLSFSSEEPYERFFGYEVLEHTREAVNLSRLKDSAPVLFNHNRDIVIGVVEDAKIEEKRGVAKIRFATNQKAEEIYKDVKEGILKNVSVGYQIEEMEKTGEKDGIELWSVKKWTPFEVSIVSVPADQSVGIGRDQELNPQEVKIINQKQKEKSMSEKKQEEPTTQDKSETKVDVAALRAESAKEERVRVREISALGSRFNQQEKADEAINSGMSLDEFRAVVLDNLKQTQNIKPVDTKSAAIGMSDKEVREFSFTKALYALANPNNRRAQEEATFEFEASRAAAERLGKTPNGILVPVDVLQKDLNVATPSAGGDLVDTTLMTGSFIQMLRNRSIMLQLATSMNGLVGDVAIPKQTGGATAYWINEGESPLESQASFGQIGFTPKTVGAYSDITRKLLTQSSLDVEAFVRGDIAKTLALAIDLATISGDGANGQPLGILNTTGIGLVELGDNGGEPTNKAMVDLETEVAIDNADIGSLKYITNARVRGKLKLTPIEAGHPAKVWERDMINGYQALATNQIPSNLTKGDGTDLSAMIFGNFADLIIAMWGGLDLMVDPYSNSTSGTVRIVGLQDVDVGVRRAESFAVIKDIITA